MTDTFEVLFVDDCLLALRRQKIVAEAYQIVNFAHIIAV